ncbi:MAG TPA: hypothetical protein PLL41_06720, partial [Smithella sp.]|nr:hypothetical protein [Smithella sp.]
YNYQLASLTVKKSSGTLLQFVRDGDPAVKGSSGALWQLTDVGDLRAKKSGGRLLLFFSIDES